uniref:Grasp_1 protein n=1 Tax=Fopius arisanus TaxID=64838 RepID=A0A0C9RD57_9HYME
MTLIYFVCYQAVLERSKTDRVTRSDEDRRRRTIIVEKKNGSYGFTLQSYGIHYKREQEIEMVTYVDYVEYDGPAFKAGMREGDVILSINGHEMDRADHKTLVNFIKNCDARMRMVVSFEDCVRKVELHMRYIELQRALQSRLSELERLCEREKSILMGRWKTHSLPARKRTPNCGASDQTPGSGVSTLNTSTVQCCRPATSTEHLLLYSVYADGRPCLIPRSTACLVAVGPPRSRSDHHHFLSKASNDSTISSRHSYHQANGSSTPAKSKAVHKTPSPSCSSKDSNPHHTSSHTSNSLCVACISSANRRRDPADGGSLDVYDLASPCCDPNCVPSRRRREKQRRARNEAQQAQQAQQIQQQTQQQTQQIQQPQHHNQKEHNQGQQHTGHSCPRSSGHSLHSITSSDVSTTVESGASCSTSLSTDTLYWDPNVQHRPPPCIQYPKPKSWDNLTTKAFGGYGFGYGYLDTASIKTHSAERPGKGHRAKTPTSSGQRRSGGSVYSGSSSGTSNRHFQPTKSTESLLGQSPYQSEVDSSSLSCECLDGNTRFLHKRQEEATYAGGSGHHLARNRRSSHGDGKLRTPANASSEVTRL